MCTVSWTHTVDGYHLLSNRDEKFTRPTAVGPSVNVRDGVRFIAPVDAAFGGTWIVVNEFGVSLCLLNGAIVTGESPAPLPDDVLSRGLLVLELASAPSQDAAAERVWLCDLTRFAPFTLAILEPARDTMLVEWTGTEKLLFPYGEPLLPLASSSFDPAGVRKHRAAQFAAMQRGVAPGVEMLRAFHAGHGEARAYSPCMHRADARTVSFTEVRVAESRIELDYQPGSPCERLPTQRIALCSSYC